MFKVISKAGSMRASPSRLPANRHLQRHRTRRSLCSAALPDLQGLYDKSRQLNRRPRERRALFTYRLIARCVLHIYHIVTYIVRGLIPKNAREAQVYLMPLQLSNISSALINKTLHISSYYMKVNLFLK